MSEEWNVKEEKIGAAELSETVAGPDLEAVGAASEAALKAEAEAKAKEEAAAKEMELVETEIVETKETTKDTADIKIPGIGIAGFIVSLVALCMEVCFGWCIYTLWLSVFAHIIAIVGVVLSAVGCSEMKKQYGKASGLPKHGLTLGIIAVVLEWIILFVTICLLIVVVVLYGLICGGIRIR